MYLSAQPGKEYNSRQLASACDTEVFPMTESEKVPVDRRDFLKSAAVGAAVLAATPVVASAQNTDASEINHSSAGSPEVDVIKMKEKIAIATRMLAGEGI